MLITLMEKVVRCCEKAYKILIRITVHGVMEVLIRNLGRACKILVRFL